MRLNWTSWNNTLRRLGLRLKRNPVAVRHHKSRAAALESLERREMLAAEVTNFHLVNDTGSNNTDRVTSDPTVTGVLGGFWSGMSAGVEFDHNGDGVKEGDVSAGMPEEEFTYYPATVQPSLATYNGTLNFKYRVVEYDEMFQVISTGSWQPFTMTLEHPLPAEIEVVDSWSGNIPDGVGSFDFGSTPRGTNVDKTFTIRNTGTGVLTINVSSFSLPSGFTLVTSPAATVAANNGTTTFTVRLNASTEGVYTGTLSFTTNDSDENPFNFTISGDVYNDEPEVEVRGPSGAAIADGGTFNLGITGQNQPITTTFTVHNSGNSSLNLSNLQVPSGVTIVSTFSTIVNSNGGQTSYTIRLEATTSGSFSGGLSFANNDSNENPYNIQLTATVNSGGGGGGGGAITTNNVRLFRDSGLSDTDSQTSDPRITGSVSGDFQSGFVDVEFDHNNNGTAEGKSMVSLTGQSFTYDPRQYESSLIGYTGVVALRYRTVHRNAAGAVVSTGSWLPLNFTMIPGPGVAALDFSELELFKDTGTNQTDRVTIHPAVYFVLSGEFGTGSARVEFDNDGDFVVDGSVDVPQADMEYDYDPREITPTLASHLGPLAIFYRLVKLDASGNVEATGAWDSFRSTINTPPASLMTVGEWALINDTGNSSTDKISTDVSVKGTALGTPTQSSTTVPVTPEIEFDLDANQVNDGWTTTNSWLEKKFTFVPEYASYGVKTIAARVREWSDLYGVYLLGAWSTFQFEYTFDAAPPVIDLELKNDTGTLATDGITRDPTLTGRLDGEDVAQLKIHLDYNNDAVDDAVAFADQQGNFRYKPRGLASGANTIKVRSSRFDPKQGGDVFGPWEDLPFTFEATPIPSATNIRLFADTGTLSTDNKTTDPTLIGNLAGDTNLINVGVEFDHDGNDQPEGYAATDGLGQFAYRPMGLGVGQRTVRARAYQWDDNLQAFVRGAWTSFSFEIEASVHAPASMTAPSLYRDTGSNDADHVTTDPSIIGTVFDNMVALKAMAYMTIEVDTNNNGTADTTVQTNAGAAFRYVPLNQAPGTYTIQFRTKEWDYTQRQGYYGPWTPITYTIVAAVNNPPVLAQLSLLGDTGSLQTDLHTANPMLTGAVLNDSGPGRLVVEFDHNGDTIGDGLAFTNENGGFYYTPEPLAFTQHTIKARPIEWDEASGSYLIGNWVPITFTYEEQPNTAAMMMSLGLLATGGSTTSDPTLTGRIINELLLSDITIEFDLNNNFVPDQFATTDAYGQFSYTPTGLGFGSVMVHARTREVDPRTGEVLYSNWSDFSFTYSQPTNAPADINQFVLKNDTGTNSSDGQTTDSTLTGHANNDGSSAGLTVQFDHNNDNVIDGTATTDTQGNFTYKPEGISFVQHTIRARVKEYDPQGAAIYSPWEDATFTLQDPLALLVRVDSLTLASDTGNSNTDGSTANATLNGHVANAGGQTLTLELDVNGDGIIDGTATTNSSGNFSYVPQNLQQGYTTVRARIAQPTTTTSPGTAQAGWKLLSFVFHSQPDGAEAQALATAFHNFNANWQNATNIYTNTVLAANQAYRQSVATAQSSYDTSISDAIAARNALFYSAETTYNSVVGTASTAFVSALTSARQEFVTDLANFQGDTTSYQLREFAWPDSPVDFALQIPVDQEQPLPPVDIGDYSGEEYEFARDTEYLEDLTGADQVYQVQLKLAQEAFKLAEQLIDADYQLDLKAAGTAHAESQAAAESAYHIAIKAGTSPVDLAEESRQLKQRTDEATRRYERARNRHQTEFLDAWTPLHNQLMPDLLAVDGWFQQQVAAVYANPTYQAYYAQHYSYPPELTQDIDNLEEQRSQQKADIQYGFDVAVAELTRTRTEKDAVALRTKVYAINAAVKSYDERAAQHAHWETNRELDASLARDQALAMADKTLAVAVSEAYRRKITRLADAAKTHDVDVATAAASRDVDKAEAQEPAVAARAAFEQTPWWEYQQDLINAGVQFASDLVQAVVDKFTSDRESDRDEISTVAQEQKAYAEQVAELRRVRDTDDAVSWRDFRAAANDHELDAKVGGSQLWSTFADTRADIDKSFSFDMAIAQETLAKETALIAKTFAYAAAASSGPVQMADACRDRDIQTANATHTFQFSSIAAMESRAESRTSARYAHETGSHALDESHGSDDVASYHIYLDAVAGHGKTYLENQSLAFAQTTKEITDEGVESASEYADSAKAVRDSQSSATNSLMNDSISLERDFHVAEVTVRKSKVAAWDAVVNTPWSAYQLAKADIELTKLTGLGNASANGASHAGSEALDLTSQLSSNEQSFADSLADALGTGIKDAADASKAFLSALAGARRSFTGDASQKIAIHDISVLARNNDYQDSISDLRRTRDDAVNDARWTYSRTEADEARDYAVADAGITHDLAIGLITSSAADQQRATLQASKAQDLVAAESLRRQTVASAEAMRANGEASEHRNWIHDVGDLDVQLATDLKGGLDSLGSNQKVAVDNLATAEAQGVAAARATTVSAQRDSTVADSSDGAAYSDDVAPIDGTTGTDLVDIFNLEREQLAEARAQFLLELMQNHAAKMANATVPQGAVLGFATYARAVADAAVVQATADALAFHTYHSALSDAYHEQAIALQGRADANGVALEAPSGGGEPAIATRIGESGQANQERQSGHATADRDFSVDVSQNMASFDIATEKAASKARKGQLNAETQYELAYVVARRDYNNAIADANVQWVQVVVQAETAYYLGLPIVEDPSYDDQAAQTTRDNALAAADEQFAAAAKAATVQHAAAIGDAQIARATQVGNTLTTLTAETNSAENAFTLACNAALAALEAARTLVENAFVGLADLAERNYTLSAMNAEANLISDLGAAEVELVRDLGQAHVGYVTAKANADTVFQSQAFGARSTRFATWAFGVGTPAAAFESAMAAAEATWIASIGADRSAYLTAMAQAAADAGVALVERSAELDNAEIAADLAYFAAAIPHFHQAEVDSVAAWRAYIETNTSLANAQRLAELAAFSALDAGYALTVKNRAAEYATAEKAYQVEMSSLPVNGNAALLIHDRNLARANSDLAQGTYSSDAEAIWTGQAAGSTRDYERDLASAVRAWTVEEARIGRDLNNALAPLEEARTIAYAAAQATYWTAEVSASNAQRTAETVAEANFRDADYSDQATSLGNLPAQVPIPWTNYVVAIAEAIRDWWINTNHAQLVAFVENLNQADTSYQSIVHVEYVAWSTARAAAERAYRIWLSNSIYAWTVSDADADEATFHELATASLTWQNDIASASRDHTVGILTAERDFALNGETPARLSALAAAASAQSAAVKSAASTFTIEAVAATGTNRQSHAESQQSYIIDRNIGALDYTNDVAEADRAYVMAEANARMAWQDAVATALANYEIVRYQSLSSAVHNAAISDPSPWMAFADARYDALEDWHVALALAHRDREHAFNSARRGYSVEEANAEKSLVLAVAQAEVTRSDDLNEAIVDRVILEVVAEQSQAQAIPLCSWADALGAGLQSEDEDPAVDPGSPPKSTPEPLVPDTAVKNGAVTERTTEDYAPPLATTPQENRDPNIDHAAKDLEAPSVRSAAAPVVAKERARKRSKLSFDPNEIPGARIREMVEHGLASYYGNGQHFVFVVDRVGTEIHFTILEYTGTKLFGDDGPKDRLGSRAKRDSAYRIVRQWATPISSGQEDPDRQIELFRSREKVDQFVELHIARLGTLTEFGAKAVEITYRIVPFGNAAMELGDGNYSEAGISLVGDAALFVGYGALAKGVQGTRAAVACRIIAVSFDAGVAGYRTYQGIGELRNGETVDGIAHIGEATLLLIGVSWSEIQQLRAARKAQMAADDVLGEAAKAGKIGLPDLPADELEEAARRVGARKRAPGEVLAVKVFKRLPDFKGPIEIDDLESILRDLPHEAVVLIDADGQILGVVKGNLDETIIPEEMVKLFRGQRSWHNHPLRGAPSSDDILGALARGDAEMIIISGTRRFRLKFPSDLKTQRLLFAELRDLFLDHVDDTNEEFLDFLKKTLPEKGIRFSIE